MGRVDMESRAEGECRMAAPNSCVTTEVPEEDRGRGRLLKQVDRAACLEAGSLQGCPGSVTSATLGCHQPQKSKVSTGKRSTQSGRPRPQHCTTLSLSWAGGVPFLGVLLITCPA